MTDQTPDAELLGLVVRPEEPAELLVEEPAEEPAVEGEWKVCMEEAPVVEVLHAEEAVPGAVALVDSHTRVAVWQVPPEDEQEEEAQAGVTSSVVLEEEWKTI